MSSVNRDADVTYEEEVEKGEDQNAENGTYKKSLVRSSSRPKRTYESKRVSEQPKIKKRVVEKEIFETNKIEKTKTGRNKKIDETVKLIEKVKDKKNGKELVHGEGYKVNDDEFSKIVCRLSPKCLHRATKIMSGEQMNVVRRIGFGKMLEMEFNEIPCKLGYFCVDKYNHETSSIELPIGNIEITKKSIHQTYGLPIGGKKIETRVRAQKGDELYVLWRKQYGGKIVRQKDVLNKILESNETGLLFVLNFLVLFATTMIEGNQLGSVNTKFLNNITNEDEIVKFDWCDYLLSCLKETVKSWKDKNTGVIFAGSISTLVLHYVQATNCGTVYVSRQRSTIAEWTTVKLRERELAEIRLGGFGKVKMIEEDGKGNIELIENPHTEEDFEHNIAIRSKHVMDYVREVSTGLSMYPENKKLLEISNKVKKEFEKMQLRQEKKGTASIVKDNVRKRFNLDDEVKKENENGVKRVSDVDFIASEGIIFVLNDLKRIEKGAEEVESVMKLEENRNSEKDREDIELVKNAANLMMLKEP